jgi:hypothetical protein
MEFHPDEFGGDFVSNVCTVCGRERERYRTDPDFICDDCEQKDPRPAPDDQ